MFSSIAEGYIQKLCGKYLKNFNSDNISIGVTGIITITDVQVKTEELINFQLPYKPASIFIGTLYADLPFVSGGNFDVRLSDVLIVVEKSDENLAELHSHELQSALQVWIGAFYLNLSNLSELKTSQSVSSSEIEYVQKLIDRLCVTIESVHFRMEEMFTAHVPCPIGEDSLCLGVMVGKIELRPPTSQELAKEPSVWNREGDTYTTRVINKLLKCTNVTIYCAREECLGSVTGAELNTAFVRKHAWNRVKGRVLGPMNLEANFSGAYQRTNLVFGPVTLSVNLEGVDFHFTDEQVTYLAGVVISFETYAHRLQLQSRFNLCCSSPDSKRRARMRWHLLRDVIKTDWWKYANTLTEGSMRWRAWCQLWCLCARYVAIRELISFHLGYEILYSYPDPPVQLNGKEEKPNPDALGIPAYSLSECLIEDQHSSLSQRDSASGKAKQKMSKEEVEKMLTKKQKRRYQGRGLFSPQALEDAENMVTAHITKPYTDTAAQMSRGQDIAMCLPISTVRVLYALQLELDSVLPIKVAAQCRLWAEERIKSRKQCVPHSIGISSQSSQTLTSSSDIRSTASTASTAVLYFAVVDASNLQGSSMGVMSSKKVEAFMSIKTSGWGEEMVGKEIISEMSSAKISAGTGSACVCFGACFSLPLSNYFSGPRPLDSTADSTNPVVQDGDLGSDSASLSFECVGSGMFSPSFGKSVLRRATLIGKDNIAVMRGKGYFTPCDASNDGNVSFDENAVFESPMTTHSGVLSHPAASSVFSFLSPPSETGDKNGLAPTLRILSMLVLGPSSTQVAAKKKFEAKVAEVTEDRKMVIDRFQKSADIDAARAQGGSLEEEEDETFVLDPSVLTVQDMQVFVTIPRLSVAIDALFLVPPTVRAAAMVKRDGARLPHTAPLPIAIIRINGLSAQAIASNNPWIVRASARLDSLKVKMFKNIKKDADGKGVCEKTILSLPAISGDFNAMQISTMSRTISGSLDFSCFECWGSAAMEPFQLVFSPKVISQGYISVWRKYRILQHLWVEPVPWARGDGGSSMGEGTGAPPLMKPEAALRFGDAYSECPRRQRIVEEISAAIKTVISESGEVEEELHQSTSMNLSTGTRSMELNLALTVSQETLLSQTTDGALDVYDEDEEEEEWEEKAEEDTALVGVSSASLFGWMGLGSTPTPVPTLPQTEAPVKKKKWSAERSLLLVRLKELELENQNLKQQQKKQQEQQMQA